MTTEVILEPDLEKEVAAMGPLVNKRRRKRGNDEADANVPPKVLRKDHDAFRPAEKTSADTKSVNDPDPLSYAKPQPHPERDVAQSSRKTATEIPTGNVATTEVQGQIFAESPKSGKSASFPSVDGSLGEIKSLKAVEAELHNLHNQTKNLEALLEAEFLDFQVSNNQLSQQVSNLQAQVTGEEKIKAAFEEFKKYEDDKVEQRCAEMDARLDKLSVDFNKELYRYKRRSETRYRSWEAGRDLAAIEAYNPEADSKYVKALQDLKDLKYPLVDQLEGLKDAPMELIMASLNIESDFGEDAPSGSKKCRVVCCTHGIRSAHHAKSDGILVSVPTIAPQELAILLEDAATQTEVANEEDEPHPRLQRSISLPPLYNLEWK
ncbi:hypothetical protein Tco_1183901 [Tanacetum coccineum]